MRHPTDTLPDRGVRMFHMMRSREKWYGVLVQDPDPQKLATIKGGLDEILERHGHVPSVSEEGRLYCKDPYTPEALEEVQQYLANSDIRATILKGDYFDFLGDYWLKQAMSKSGR